MGRLVAGRIAALQEPSRDDGDLARQSFDAATAMTQARTLADLDRMMQRFIPTLGFSHVLLAETRNGETAVVAGAPPALWWPHAIERGYQREDIVYRAALQRSVPFFYSDLEAMPDLSARQKRINGERHEFGLREGFVSPSHFRSGLNLSVVMVGADVDARDPDVCAAAHVISMFYRMAAQALMAPPGIAPVPTLTDRQCECLTWVRAGKSAGDIGAILGISAHTVNEHVAEACRRLNVRTRVQAVMAAIALHLIAT